MKNKIVKSTASLFLIFAMAGMFLPENVQAKENEPSPLNEATAHWDTLECYGYPLNCMRGGDVIITN